MLASNDKKAQQACAPTTKSSAVTDKTVRVILEAVRIKTAP
jgi:hypothetical protein